MVTKFRDFVSWRRGFSKENFSYCKKIVVDSGGKVKTFHSISAKFSQNTSLNQKPFTLLEILKFEKKTRK
jgi:hypothetical protein